LNIKRKGRSIPKYRLNGETLYPFAAFILTHRAQSATAVFAGSLET
jgi:hypothetical protein